MANPSMAEMQQELARLREENARLAAKASGTITFKVSPNKEKPWVVCLYGFGRNPLSTSAANWYKLLTSKEEQQKGLDVLKANHKTLVWVKGSLPGVGSPFL